ncbi:DUF7537 family lipoprotein [Halomarina litorea]|uniref:DUF7537 family lipoprotein n=1 Tax=Halomarina litorea TaxID=2961595 RepID=UPI0020C2A7A2|nr:hypothetical protein [Halomarina sp. BCD28]
MNVVVNSRSRRALAALLCAVLVVTAGCLGGLTGSERDGTTTTDAPGTPVGTTDAPGGADETATADGRPYPATLPDGEAILARHTGLVEERGSVTVRSTFEFRSASVDVTQNTTIRSDLDAETYNRSIEHIDGLTAVTYGSFGEGAVEMSVLSTGKRRYHEARAVERRKALAGVEAGAFDKYDFEYAGTVEAEGTTLHHYTVTSLDQVVVREIGTVTGEVSPENISAFTRDAYFTEAGRLVRYEAHMVYDYGGERTVSQTLRVTDVGETSVEEPAWYDEAKRSIENRPRPDDVVTRTDSDRGATLSVTGERHAVGGQYTDVEVREPWFCCLYNEGTNASRASEIVGLDLPETYGESSLTVEYDESRVPDGDESGLVLVRFDREAQTFVRVEATHDAEANTFTLDSPAKADYAVFHWETWVAQFD